MWTRAAPAMFSLTTSWMPAAAASVERPSVAARSAIAFGGGSPVDLQRAAGKEIGIQIAEQQIGVGHGRRGPAASITGRARLRAGAVRPDLEQTDLIATRDAAAAGADLDQFDRRQADRQAAAFDKALLPRRLEPVGDQRLAAIDQAQLGGGAAHIKGEQVVDPVARRRKTPPPAPPPPVRIRASARGCG